MLRRRNVAPPYEVMRTTPPRAGSAPAPRPSSTPEPSVIHRAPGAGAGAGGAPPVEPANVWSRFNTPILLRLPRGLIAMLLLAVLVLLGLAYWVGRSMATRDADQQDQTIANSVNGEVDRLAQGSQTPAAPLATNGNGNANAAPGGGQEAIVPPDPSGVRRAGLNYLVLANYSRAEDAKRLADYLGKNGVAVEIVRVKMSGPFQVVAMRGFPGSELRTAGESFRKQMQALGRKWKREQKGDTEFEHAYFDKYEGG